MIRFACPGCTATFTVADDKAGKSGKCPKCQSQFVIPSEISPDDPNHPPVELSAVPPPLPPQPAAVPAPPPVPGDPVEIQPCPKCRSRLSVMPGDVGLDIECPNCQTVYKALRSGDAPPPPRSDRDRPRSGGNLVRYGSGSERRDDDDRRDRNRRDRGRRDDEEDDRRSRTSSRRRRDEDDEDDPDRRYRRRRRDDDYDRPRYEPHRGGMILAFGILGIMVCAIFGILAWTMGAADLKAMDDGRMDPEGRGMTRAGQIIGMISCLIIIAVMVFYCGIVGLAGAAGGFR